MKKILFFGALFLVLVLGSAQAQNAIAPGFAYQVMLRDENQKLLANQELQVSIRLRGAQPTQLPFYSEQQVLVSTEDGLLSMVIGEGNNPQGSLLDLPWATEEIWLDLLVNDPRGVSGQATLSTQLMAVPYAVYAHSAANLEAPTDGNAAATEKNQSIFWLTGGNTDTNPAVHFLGTRDNQNLTFKTNNRTTMTLTTQGRLLVYNYVPAGTDDDINDYPVVVKGTTNAQGVWVQINAKAEKKFNFVTFEDSEKVQGRIEGQTLPELEASPAYQYESALAGLNAAALTGKIIELAAKAIGEGIGAVLAAALIIPTFGATATSVSGLTAGVVATGLKIDAAVIELATYINATTSYFNRVRSNVGVSYSTGGADYAEWIPRRIGERQLVYGEVVGVKNGEVSLATKGADHLLVISRAPAYLGKDLGDNLELTHEKVAFMGQVLVRVMGKVKSGDYILASGKEDGMAIAVDPAAITPGQLSQIIGTAWESGQEELPVNLINVAVGLKSSAALAHSVSILEDKLTQLQERAGLPSTGDSMLAAKPESTSDAAAWNPAVLTPAETEQLFRRNAEFITQLFAQVKAKLDQDGIAYNQPQLQALFANPVETLIQFKRNPRYLSE